MRIKRIISRALGILLSLILVAYLAAHFIVPEMLDRKFNAVYNSPPHNLASENAKRLHKSLLIADLHADPLIWSRDLLVRNNFGQVDIPRLIESNVALQVFAAPTKVPSERSQWGTPADGINLITLAAITQFWSIPAWFKLDARAEYLADKLHGVAEDSDGKFVIVRTAEDLNNYLQRRASQSDLTAGLLAIEGLHALEGKLDNVNRLFDVGYRMMGLVHQFDNELGGSSYGMQKGGLTDFGKQVIKRMEELHILVDLAHASPALIDDVLNIAKRPVVVSHTGVQGTCNRLRNISDEHIRRIASSGGLIGIGFWSGATCGTDAQAIARSIRYVADLVGVDHVALGSDFDGDKMPFDVTGIVQITDALLAEGFSEDEIRRIMGGNVLKLLLQVLPQ